MVTSFVHIDVDNNGVYLILIYGITKNSLLPVIKL